jgi:hypothetical protein
MAIKDKSLRRIIVAFVEKIAINRDHSATYSVALTGGRPTVLYPDRPQVGGAGSRNHASPIPIKGEFKQDANDEQFSYH